MFRLLSYSKVNARSSIGAGYARSEAELEQIMDGLHEQEVRVVATVFLMFLSLSVALV